MKRIGILTGGGDCPGLNAVIRAAVRTLVFSKKGAPEDAVLRDLYRGTVAFYATQLMARTWDQNMPGGFPVSVGTFYLAR